MESFWGAILWKQFGAAIDMLDNALVACPDTLWRQPVWQDSSAPSGRAEFWYVAYHTLFWLDLYLFGTEEGFAPPAPYALVEQDDASGPIPDETYSKEQVRTYLAYCRDKCRSITEMMTDERARQPVSFGWVEDGEVISYYELQLYNMRHVQEHAAQLNLLLGRNGIPGEQIDWVARARDDVGG